MAVIRWTGLLSYIIIKSPEVIWGTTLLSSTVFSPAFINFAYQNRGIRIKGMPKDSAGIWALFKTRYGEAVSSFCTDKLIARGYAQSMQGVCRVRAADGTLVENKICGKYAYLIYGCELAIIMKSSKRAVVEIFCVDKRRFNLECWRRFTLTNTDQWKLDDIKQKLHEKDKWENDTL